MKKSYFIKAASYTFFLLALKQIVDVISLFGNPTSLPFILYIVFAIAILFIAFHFVLAGSMLLKGINQLAWKFSWFSLGMLLFIGSAKGYVFFHQFLYAEQNVNIILGMIAGICLLIERKKLTRHTEFRKTANISG